MTLLDFFIKITLIGRPAVQQLAAVTAEANKTKAALNSVGAAASKTEKKTAQAAASMKRSLAGLGRSVRAGGGFRLGDSGGAGLSLAFGPFMSALSAAPGPLKLLAGAALAAVISLRSLSKIQDAEAANVIAINPRDAQGNIRTPAQIATIRAEQRRLAFDGPVLNIQGQNVLRGRSALQNTQDIGAMERAGVTATAATLAAFARISMLSEDASDEDRAKLAATANKEAMRRAGTGSGEVFEKYFNEELTKVIKLAGDTHRSVSEAIRAQPVAQALIEPAGLSSSEVFALQSLSANEEATGRVSARHINSMLVDMLASADTKKVRTLKASGTELFDDNGKFKGLENFVSEMNELEAKGGQVATTIKGVFGENNVAPLLDFIKNFDNGVGSFKQTVDSYNTDSTLAADNAAVAQADTITTKGAEVGASFERLMISVGSMGFDIIFGHIADVLIFFMDELANLINIVGAITRPILTIIDTVLRFIYAIAAGLRDKLFGLLPKGAQDFIKNLIVPAGAKTTPSASSAPVKAGQGTAANVAAKRSDVAAAGREASAVVATQTTAQNSAAQIKALAVVATQNVSTFAPLLAAAQKFEQGLLLSFTNARLGVETELLRMVAAINSAIPQFGLAGLALGSAFTTGLNSGFSTAAAAPAGPVIYNDNRRVTGATPRTVERTAQAVVNQRGRAQSATRNLAR